MLDMTGIMSMKSRKRKKTRMEEIVSILIAGCHIGVNIKERSSEKCEKEGINVERCGPWIGSSAKQMLKVTFTQEQVLHISSGLLVNSGHLSREKLTQRIYFSISVHGVCWR